MHQKPWSKSCQERRSREPFVHTSCWMWFSTDCYCPNRWMYHFHAWVAGIEQEDAESSDNTPCTNSDLKAAESLYDELMAMTKDAKEVAKDEAIARIQAICDGHVETLAKDPTASLWIQYLDMIWILRKFIRAEWLGNWYLHIEAVSDMLPYLAASGDSLYANSASIYLSSMANLPSDHLVVHQQRQVKLGNDATWKTLTPCFSQCLKEIRLLRAHLWGTSWRESIATGDVDVCRAKEIGQKIMDSMTGIPVAQYTFKRSDQVTTVQSKYSVRVDGQPIHVDPDILFQRLMVASNAIDDRRAFFRFELCSYPSALFDDTLMTRSPQKAVLVNAIWTRLPPDIAWPTGEVQHVLDGGALLHRITWPHGFPTYQEICTLYCDYESRNFGPAIVIFDGSRIPSTKYTTHQRRTGGKVGIEVTITGDIYVFIYLFTQGKPKQLTLVFIGALHMKLTMSKDVFLLKRR